MIFPSFGNHHQHRVGQGASAKVKEFEGLIEAGGVRCPLCHHRQRPLEGVAE